MVKLFYQQKPPGLFWCSPGEREAALRQGLRTLIDSAGWEGLDSQWYLPNVLRQADSVLLTGTVTDRAQDFDRWFTEAALALASDRYRGTDVPDRISYDGVSDYFTQREAKFLVNGLLSARTGEQLQGWLESLSPGGAEFRVLRDSLRACRLTDRTREAAQLAEALNTFRWIHHFAFNRVIVVNIPSACLRYFEKDSLLLDMKVVAGQPSKRTPRFAAWCDGIVLYPYWNVPHKIAVRELLPVFKSRPTLVNTMEMEIVDGRGHVVDPLKIDWASYTPASFPYRIRQAPGCFNALGVIKFNLNAPFDVYMHDTNLKSAFQSAARYYSHGCIRLEKPFDLGRALLRDRLDTLYLQSCLRDQRPVAVALDKAVPVFVVYCTVEADLNGKLSWFRDVYHLEK